MKLSEVHLGGYCCKGQRGSDAEPLLHLLFLDIRAVLAKKIPDPDRGNEDLQAGLYH